MHNSPSFPRRTFLGASIAMGTLCAPPTWAQPSTSSNTSGPLVVAQIVDMSPDQIDVSKDFLVGARAAWSGINAKGGVRGQLVKHLVLETDGSMASLHTALKSIKTHPQCLALFGTTAGKTARLLANSLPKNLPTVAHIAPWLPSVDLSVARTTFPLFAPRHLQMAHAIKSLSGMGISELGVVYGSPEEYAAHQSSLALSGPAQHMRITTYGPSPDLYALGATLRADSPRVLIFLGATPELHQFCSGLDRLALQRYVIAMADVNLQTLQQLGVSKRLGVIATQVTPMANAATPMVRLYRETLSRLYDEPPTSHSLAGFMAARYTYEIIKAAGDLPTPSSVLQACKNRGTIDLGGFAVTLQGKERSGSFVTQSMLSSNGRLIG